MAFQPRYVKMIGPRLRVVLDDSNCVMLEIGEDGVERERETLSDVAALREALAEVLVLRNVIEADPGYRPAEWVGWYRVESLQAAQTDDLIGALRRSVAAAQARRLAAKLEEDRPVPLDGQPAPDFPPTPSHLTPPTVLPCGMEE